MSTTTPLPAPVAHPRPEGWWAYPLLAGGSVYCAGMIPQVPWWAALLVGVALAGAGWKVGRHLWDDLQFGSLCSYAVASCLTAAGLGVGGWLAAAYLLGPLAVWQALALGTVVAEVWWALLMLVAPIAARRQDAPGLAAAAAAAEAAAAAAAAEAAASPGGPYIEVYRRVLDRHAPEVEVTGVTASPSGAVHTVHLSVRDSADGKDITRATFDSRLGRIGTTLATALKAASARKILLQEGDVRTEAGETMADFRLLVMVGRLPERIPFVPAAEPRVQLAATDVGRWMDDERVLTTLFHPQEGAVHGDMPIPTGGGKTNTINVWTARHLEFAMGEVWFVGKHKLVKMARPWLEPWLRGETDRPVLDRVSGEDMQAVLRALSDAHQFATITNRKTPGNQARVPTPGKGFLWLVIDEKTHVLEDMTPIRCWDGEKRTASQLVRDTVQLARTAQVGVMTSGQDGLYASAGKFGPQLSRNMRAGAVGWTKSNYDATQAIPLTSRQNPQKLRIPEVFVVTPYDEPRELPAKFYFLPDEQVPVLARQYTPWRYGLDPAITRELAFYADRWDPQWHAELIDSIADKDVPQNVGLRYPLGPGQRLATRVSFPLAGAGGVPSAAAPAEPPAGGSANPVNPTADPADPGHTGSSTQPEESTVSDPELPPVEGVPADFYREDFDAWGAFVASMDQPAVADPHAPAPAAPSAAPQAPTDEAAEQDDADDLAASYDALRNPDLGPLQKALDKVKEEGLQRWRQFISLPEPLGPVLREIAARRDLPEGVPTVILAWWLGMFDPETATKEEKARATADLGMRLYRQAGIKSIRLGLDVDRERRNGYLIADLRTAAERLTEAA
jgi:hypothetical protein